MERRKAEESREVREHLQRHITKWESMKEELSLLQRGKELQDNELHRLRKGNRLARCRNITLSSTALCAKHIFPRL